MIKLLNGKLLETHEKYTVFGIILFTEAHPHVIKVLRDVDYWNALDEISGEKLGVFAARLFKQEWKYPSLPPGFVGKMIPMAVEPNANKEILSWFDIKDSTSLPLFVLFGVDRDELFYRQHPIRSESSEAAYRSLEEVIKTIAAYLQSNSDLSDRDKLYQGLGFKLKVLRVKNVIQKIIQVASSLRGASGI